MWPNLLLFPLQPSLKSLVHVFHLSLILSSFYTAFCVSFPSVSLSTLIDWCFLNGCQEVLHTHVHVTLSPIGNSVSADRKGSSVLECVHVLTFRIIQSFVSSPEVLHVCVSELHGTPLGVMTKDMFYASVPVRGFPFLCPSICPSSSPKHNISVTPWGNILNFGTNIHFYSRMYWSDFGGQRSRLLWSHRTCFWPCEHIVGTLWGIFFKFGTNQTTTRWWFSLSFISVVDFTCSSVICVPSKLFYYSTTPSTSLSPYCYIANTAQQPLGGQFPGGVNMMLSSSLMSLLL